MNPQPKPKLHCIETLVVHDNNSNFEIVYHAEPDGAPRNVRGHNRSSTSISVSWDQVPVEQENGIITGYTIKYHSQTENDNGTVPAGPSERQKTISGLKEYVDYNIAVFASTVKGDGPLSSPVLVVRTDQASK